MSFLNRVIKVKNVGILGLLSAVAIGLPIDPPVATGQTITPSSYSPSRTVSVKFVNETGKPVIYHVSGRTDLGMIPQDGEFVLERVLLPATISVAAKNNQYLRVISLNSENDYLQVDIVKGDSENWEATNMDEFLEMQDDNRILLK